MAPKVLYCAVVFVCALWIESSSGSAIPMWEYLSRGEKMSHLYTMFAKQVNTYCKSNTADHSMKPQCKRDLLLHGLGNLNKMDEPHLDSMDPYQRGATDIVWDHMMDGHPMMVAKKEVSTSSPIRLPTGNYQRNPLFDDVDEQPKRPVKTHEDIYAMGMDSDPMNGQYQLPKDQENLYPEPQNHLHQETKVSEKYVSPMGAQSGGYLNGPMMIMVRPDGTPVHAYMPKDDDQEAMTLGRDSLPSIDQLARSFAPTRNYLDENEDVVATVQPRRPTGFRNARYQPQKRSFYHHPSYVPQGYRSNQH